MKVAGICLAAGASTRMGRPKALLDYGGQTALAIAVRNLREGGCEPVVVVLGADAERVAPRVPGGARVVVNADWAKGRTGSIQAGLEAAPDASAFVILPVDHPLVTPADVASLLAAWREGRPPVARPVREGRGGHPVLLDATLLPELRALPADAPLRDFLAAHREGEVRVPGSPGVLVNVDTPEEYEGLTLP